MLKERIAPADEFMMEEIVLLYLPYQIDRN
jgi:hypothetical protein